MIVFLKLSIYLLFSLILLGCSSAEVTSPNIIYKSVKVNAVVDSQLMVMKKKFKNKLIENSRKGYIIKSGDVIIIKVSGYPEFSTSNSPSLTDKTIVNQNGTIQLPALGVIKVVGFTTNELRKFLIEKLRYYIITPDVTVSLAFNRKNRYNLIGEFSHPKTIEKNYQMTLLEVLSFGDGIKQDTADLKNAYVVRNKKKLPINIYRLLEKGDISQNIDMMDRDTVVIPRYQTDQSVYIYTRLSRLSKPRIPLINGKLTVIQAMTMSGILEVNEKIINLNNVYVVRTEADRIETFKLDTEKMFKGEAIPFELVAGDMIYIPKENVGTINKVITDFFPIVQLTYSILNNIQAYRIVRDYGTMPDN